MAIWLDAWTGDNAGPVVGAKPNRLLVAAKSAEDLTYVSFFKSEQFHGFSHFFNLFVTSLADHARPAIVIDSEQVGHYVWSLEIAEVNFGDPTRQPWPTGAQLFSMVAFETGPHQSAAIASAIIDDDVVRIDASLRQSQWEGGWPLELAQLRDTVTATPRKPNKTDK